MRWANEHPEQMADIAALPLNQQNAALRHAIGYDPDRIRDEAEEHARHVTGDRPTSPRGAGEGASHTGSASRGGGSCEVCGAPADVPHAHYCDLRGQK